MIRLEKPDDKIYESILRLKSNRDFAEFKLWLVKSLNRNYTRIPLISDKTVLRWMQGSSQLLDDLIRNIEEVTEHRKP
jgi:hypothetical protein